MRELASVRALRRSAGVGLVTAIFLLVVLAGLAVAMVTVFTSQQAVSVLDEQGARAYQAARAGVEWGVFMQTQGGGCPGLAERGSETPTSFPLPADSSLRGFTVTVTCTRIGLPADPLMRVVITSVACSQPGPAGCPNYNNSPDYVQRMMEAEL